MKSYQDLIFGKCTIGARADIYPEGDDKPGERWVFISTHDTKKKAAQVAEEVGGGRIESYINGYYRRGWTVLKFCRYVPAKEQRPAPMPRPMPTMQLELFPA
jgi:hypothetical protein